MRSLGALLRLAVSRIRHRRATILLVAGGVAVASAALLGTLPVSVLGQDAALERAVEQGAGEERTLRVAIFRASGGGAAPGGLNPLEAALDPEVTPLLPRRSFEGRIERGVLFRSFGAGRGEPGVRLVALDRPRPYATRLEGRLPRRCEPPRCEAVALGDFADAGETLRAAGLRLRIVGQARLDTAPMGRVPPPGDQQAFGVDIVYVLVRGFDALLAPGPLEDLERTYFWWERLDPDAIHPWNLDDVLAELTAAERRLGAEIAPQELAVPRAELLRERTRARAAGKRLLVMAGLAAAAILSLAAFAAVQRRRDIAMELERLRGAGARRGQLAVFVLFEAGFLALLGVAAGWLAAAAGTVVAATLRDRDPLDVLGASVFGPTGITLALLALGAATLILVASGLDRDTSNRRLAVEGGAVVGLAMLIWQGASRGALDAADLAASDAPPAELLVLPALVAFIFALVAVRLLPLAFRALERAARGGSVTLRLASLSLTRNASRSAAAVGFLVLSLAAGGFALAYSHNLREGQRDSAAYRSGEDLRVREGTAVPRNAPDVLPLDRYRRLGVEVAGVARTRASMVGESEPVELLGVPAQRLAGLRGWRADFMPDPMATAASKLRSGGRLRLQGTVLPEDATRLELTAEVTGRQITVTAAIQQRSGRFRAIALGRTLEARRHELSVPVPSALRGGRLVAIEVLNVFGVRDDDDSDRGSLTLSNLRGISAGGRETRIAPFDERWEGSEGTEFEALPGGMARLSYSVLGDIGPIVLRHRQPALDRPLPALVSSRLDLDAGEILTLALPGGGEVDVRSVARPRLFPTTDGRARRFVIVDAGALLGAANAAQPGALAPNEAWLRLPSEDSEDGVVAALRRAPFRTTSIVSHAALERQSAADPLAKTAIWSLWALALLCFAIAVTGLGSAVAGALRDETEELKELEALGVPPSALRRQLRVSVALAVAFALPMALASAVVLTEVFTASVELDAAGRDPLPPLRSGLPWPQLLTALCLAGTCAAVLCVTLTRRAFRGASAGRLGG